MRLEPSVLPETEPFWTGADDERLTLPRCRPRGHVYFPPAPICPVCSATEIEWFDATGRATLYSYVIAQRPWPHWSGSAESPEPMSVAMIELEEGPRLLSTVVDCPQTQEALTLDMPLIAVWRPFGERPRMLCFRPANPHEQAQ